MDFDALRCLWDVLGWDIEKGGGDASFLEAEGAFAMPWAPTASPVGGLGLQFSVLESILVSQGGRPFHVFRSTSILNEFVHEV